MNKKVDEEFENIKDVYLLQCICTELKDKIDTAIEYIKENIEIALVNGESQELIDREDIPVILEILGDKE